MRPAVETPGEGAAYHGTVPENTTPPDPTSAAASASSGLPLEVTIERDGEGWDREVNALGGHPLQLTGWAAAKEHGGTWRSVRLRVSRGAHTVGLAQVLVRKLPPVLRSVSYVPRGPVVPDEADRAQVVAAVTDWARERIGGVGITFEPQWPAGSQADIPGSVPAEQHVLLARTMVIDLTRSEEELLAGMTRTTRQGVRRSGRTDLDYREVASDAEFEACLALYRETAERAGFDLHPDDYYRTVRQALGRHAPTFAAFEADRPVAFLMLAASDRTSFELYAGADEVGRKLRANYSLKWTAILAMKARGLTEYDVNGLLNDGISDFKRSFAQHEDHWVGSWDVPFAPLRYRLWTQLLPLAKRTVRTLAGLRRRASA